jgi:RNA polymerase sigma-70 factor (ECF subfamily)
VCPALETAPSPAAELSFRQVFVEHAPYVWRCLRRLGVGSGDVEDVCQEVFVVVHRKLHEYDGRASVRSWLYGFCVRKASDYRRSSRVRHESVTAELPEVAVASGQDEVLDRRSARELLDAALDRLDDGQRAAFVLYEIEELPMVDVARIVGCPVQTAYSRLHAARKLVEAAVKRARAKEGTA